MKTLAPQLTRLALPRLLALVFCALGVVLFSGGECEGAVQKRSVYPFSNTSQYAGNINGALYLIDSQVVKQFDRTGRVRLTLPVGANERYWFSPNGFNYLVSGYSKSEIQTKSDSELTGISGLPKGNNYYALYDVMGRQIHVGRASKNAKFYLSSTGRYLIANSDVGSGVEIVVFDSLGVQIGLCHVASCDTVIFAPSERGFLVDSGSKGLFHFYFSGDKLASYPAADCYNFSLSGRRIATFSRGSVSLYKLDTLLSTHKVSRPTALKIIYQGSRGRVFLLTKTHLYNINTINGTIMMDYPTFGEGRVFTDVAYSPESDMLALTIIVSRGSTVSKGKQISGYALRVITPEGTEQPYYNILTNLSRKGFPLVQLKKNGRGALFLTPDQAHNVDW